MRTRLVRIGNSRGVRLPKPLIAQAGLTDEVEMQLTGGAITIRPAKDPRRGWAEAAQRMHDRKEDRLLDTPAPVFDDTQWNW